ncbi:hypothetical protein MTO96_016590 [Rhipicephalus appendiculatus]
MSDDDDDDSGDDDKSTASSSSSMSTASTGGKGQAAKGGGSGLGLCLCLLGVLGLCAAGAVAAFLLLDEGGAGNKTDNATEAATQGAASGATPTKPSPTPPPPYKAQATQGRRGRTPAGRVRPLRPAAGQAPEGGRRRQAASASKHNQATLPRQSGKRRCREAVQPRPSERDTLQTHGGRSTLPGRQQARVPQSQVGGQAARKVSGRWRGRSAGECRQKNLRRGVTGIRWKPRE